MVELVANRLGHLPGRAMEEASLWSPLAIAQTSEEIRVSLRAAIRYMRITHHLIRLVELWRIIELM